MQTYIGTKIIKARPMTRAEYNVYRGWELPADENGEDEGMLVEYIDGGQANHPLHDGYISWSPADVFARAYRTVENMTFGHAIEALKAGQRVARAGWNGRGMWLTLIQPKDDLTPHRREYAVFGMVSEVGPCLPWIGMKTADNKFVPWLASQTDMLSEDWLIVE